MQAAKAATPTKPVPLPACAQPIERFGDDNTAVTMPTTMFAAGQSIEAAIGDSACWFIPAFCAFVFLLGYCLPDQNGDSWWGCGGAGGTPMAMR